MTSDLDVQREIQRFDPEYRRTHLGASEWPAACGLSPYMAPIDLWAQHVGQAAPMEATPATDLGHDLEAGVIRNAARRLGVEVCASPTMEHPEHRFACATPDATTLGRRRYIQAKTSGLVGHASLADWGDEGTDEAPEHVIAQVTGEMFVGRAAGDPVEAVDVAALLPGHGVRLYRVAWDAELAAMLWERVRAFWACVQSNTPPPPDASESYTKHLARRYPTPNKNVWRDSTAIVDAHAHEYIEARAREKQAKADKIRAMNCVCDYVGNDYGVRGPWGRAAFYPVKGKTALDADLLVDRLRVMLGDEKAKQLVKECTRQGSGHRAFKLTPTNGNDNNGDDE